MDGYQPLNLEQLQTVQGVMAINDMFRKLFDNAASDGETVRIYRGYGTPEGAVPAGIGSIFQRLDGGTGTTIYAKESGTGATGWSAL